MGKLTENIKGNTNEVIGKVKQCSSNTETKSDGKKQELKGKGQNVKGAIMGALGDDI